MEILTCEQGSEATRFGRLTLLRVLPDRSADKHIRGLWRCDCGTEKAIAMTRVRNGRSKSCGCLSPEISRVINRKHGMKESPEYSSWQAMKWRCLDPDNKDYPRWGGRGVTVCEEWIASFEAFYAHIGPRPKGTTLDRIDGRLGYEKGNVRWATAAEQARNRTNSFAWTVKGLSFDSAQAAANHFGVSDMTIHRWVHGGFDRRRNSRIAPKEGCHAVPRY
jgi:hypothetical protein